MMNCVTVMMLLLIEGGSQYITRLEGQHPARGDGHFFVGLGVPPLPGGLLLGLEVAESGNLELSFLIYSLLHQFEDQLNDVGSLFLGAVDGFSDSFGDFGFGHLKLPPVY